ncbi:MAG: tyrosine-type recombinase/integrase [Labrenzia sp.]
MLLRIVRPMRRPESSNLQFVQRIPNDIRDRASGTTLLIPVGEGVVTKRLSGKADRVKLSLGTSDPTEAKKRNAQIAAYLESVWQSLRQGPIPLTHKQIVALSGELYEIWTKTLEDDPPSRSVIDKAKKLVFDAFEGNAGPLQIGERAQRIASMEAVFGGLADVLLSRRSLVTDQESRERLLVETGKVMAQAWERLDQVSQGDYSPDRTIDRFPSWADASSKPQPPMSSASYSLDRLLSDWWAEAKTLRKSDSTYNAYSRALTLLQEFLKHNDATRVSEEDLARFKDYCFTLSNPRTGKPLTAKTIKDSYFAGLKSLFGWAVENKKLPVNPASSVKIRSAKRIRTRDKDFTPTEAAKILSAAKTYTSSAREFATTKAAKRWVPWICAYTGARVGEIIQLRKKDIFVEEGINVLLITPEAGTVKTGEARKVPIHSHLIDEGFLEFVAKSKGQYLFVEADKGPPSAGKLKSIRNRIEAMVRVHIPDPEVQPNHGWRHTFKTVGREAGIEANVLDAIQGHSFKTEGGRYGTFSVKARKAAIDRFPSFSLQHLNNQN